MINKIMSIFFDKRPQTEVKEKTIYVNDENQTKLVIHLQERITELEYRVHQLESHNKSQ